MTDGQDELLDPDEIEALLASAGANQPPPASEPDAKDNTGDDSTGSPPSQPGDKPAQEASSASGEPDDNPPSSSSAPPGDGGEPISQSDLDDLFAKGVPAADAPAPAAEAGAASRSSFDAEGPADGILNDTEIERLLGEKRPVAAPPKPAAATSREEPVRKLPAGAEELLQQAEAGLAAAISDPNPLAKTIAALGQPEPFELDRFGGDQAEGRGISLRALQDVELNIRIELGRTELLIDEVLQLRDGSIVPLDKLAGDPVDVLVNGRLLGRGDVLVLNDNFCVRLTEILPPHLQ